MLPMPAVFESYQIGVMKRVIRSVVVCTDLWGKEHYRQDSGDMREAYVMQW